MASMVLQDRVACYSAYALVLLNNIPAPARTISEIINERFARAINTAASDVYSVLIKAKNACLFGYEAHIGQGRQYYLQSGFYQVMQGEIRQATEAFVVQQAPQYTNNAGIVRLLKRQKNMGPPSLVSVFNGATVKYKKLRQTSKEPDFRITYKRLRTPKV